MKKRMTAILLVIAMFSMLLPTIVPTASASTFSGKCGENLTWTLNTDNGILEITGTGPMDDWSLEKSPWNSYRSYIKTVRIGNGVTSIGKNAFGLCSALEAVIIPDSVLSIRDGAFVHCTMLKRIALPDNVMKIEKDAFYDTGYFNNAANWTKDVLYIGKYLIKAAETKAGTYSVLKGTTVIADTAFYGLGKLTGITIPDSVKSLGDETFYNCENLTSVTIGNGVTSIGKNTFNWDFKLTNVTLGSSVKSIDDWAFANCIKLANLTLPDKVECIGDFAFSNCEALTSISIPDSVTTIGQNAFESCFGLKSLLIGSGVKTIGTAAFLYCSALTNVTLDSSVKSIGCAAFRECNALTDVNFLGTKEEWDAIQIEEANECLTEANTHFAVSGCNHEHAHPEHKDPACTETGYDRMVCDNCDGVVSETAISPLGHSFVNGVCARCGADESVVQTNSGNCGKEGDGSNLTWMLDTETGVLKISGSGAMFDYSRYGNHIMEPWYDQREAVKHVELPDGLTEIGEYAFWLCKNLDSINFPSSLKRIGAFAFSGTALTAIEIPEGVEIIGAKAFSSCRNLASVSLPSTLHRLGTEVFIDSAIYDAQITSESNDVYIDNYLVKASNVPFGESVVKPMTYRVKEGTIGIASEAFGIYSDVETAYIPSSVRMLSSYAFSDDSLVNVYIADGIEEIEPYVFYGDGLNHIELPASVKKISEHAFAGNKDNPRGRTINELCFFGAAPEVDDDAFRHNNGRIAVSGIYFLYNQAGWSYPSWNGVAAYWWTGEKVIKNYCADIEWGAWYIPAIDFVIGNGLMNGVSEERFDPNGSMTRAMLVTVLWRFEGSPKEGENSFTDLTAGWYIDAVAWAAKNGIVTGVGDNKFNPNGSITREQMAAIIYRYAQKKGFDTTNRGDLKSFPDGAKVSSYATDAIGWTVAESIINGNGGRLDPQGNATRAQVATILMRFIQNIAQAE